MPDQLRLLNELALFGGVQIVRHRRLAREGRLERTLTSIS